MLSGAVCRPLRIRGKSFHEVHEPEEGLIRLRRRRRRRQSYLQFAAYGQIDGLLGNKNATVKTSLDRNHEILLSRIIAASSKPDVDPVLAALIRAPTGLWHSLDAPCEIVNEIEIRLDTGWEYQIVLRHKLELLHQGAGRIKRTGSADQFTTGQSRVLAGVFAPNVLAKELEGLAVKG